jgi:hypothetical protein
MRNMYSLYPGRTVTIIQIGYIIQSVPKVTLTEKPDIKTTYLLGIVLQKLFKMCARVLAPSPHSNTHTETCFNTFKQVSTRITLRNKAELLFSSR